MLDNKKSSISTTMLSFLISLIYVSCATVVCYMDGYNHYIPPILSLIFYLLFLPAIIFPNLILFAEGDGASSIPYMLVCQTITLIGIWAMTYAIVRRIRKKREARKNNSEQTL